MKRTLMLLGCFIALGTTTLASVDIASPERNSLNIKVGFGTGDVDYDRENNYDYDISLSNTSLNLEYLASYNQGLELGVGTGIARNSVDDWDWEVTTIPVYAIARYKWSTNSDWDPYVFANLGYAFSNFDYSYDNNSGYSYSREVTGGLYSALGLGAEYKEKFSVEIYWNKSNLGYEEHNSSGDKYDGDFDVDMVTLALGYRLDI